MEFVLGCFNAITIVARFHSRIGSEHRTQQRVQTHCSSSVERRTNLASFATNVMANHTVHFENFAALYVVAQLGRVLAECGKSRLNAAHFVNALKAWKISDTFHFRLPV